MAGRDSSLFGGVITRIVLNVSHDKLRQLAGHDIDLGREAKAKIDAERFRS